MRKNIDSKFAIVIIILVATCIGLALWFNAMNIDQSVGYTEENTTVNEGNSTGMKMIGDTKLMVVRDGVSCDTGWKFHRHEIIGISFCYPEDWGEPETSPGQSITRLEGITDKYGENNGFHNNIQIEFPDQFKVDDDIRTPVRLRIFNDNFLGLSGPFGGHAGYRDNVERLKETQSICDYKIDYDHKGDRKYIIQDIVNECKNGTNKMLIESDQFFGFNGVGQKYTYELKSYGYKKLRNGHYDNALIEQAIDGTGQISKKVVTLDNFFTQNRSDLTYVDYVSHSIEFESFVDSIRSEVPPAKDLEPLEVVFDESVEMSLVREYYWNLSNGDFDSAYALKIESQSIESFRDQYKEISYARPYDFQVNTDNSLSYFVDYQDHNKPEQRYNIKATVGEEGINVLSVERYMSDIVDSEEQDKAYSIAKNGKTLMILERGGKRQIINEGIEFNEDDISTATQAASFGSPEFSKDGRYLMYSRGGWEYGGRIIYDIKGGKQITEVGYPEDLQIIDGKYLFYCTSPGIGSGSGGKVYTLPNFKLVFDLAQPGLGTNMERVSDVDCSYSEEDGSAVFEMRRSYYDDKSNKQVVDPVSVERFELK